MDTIYDAHVHLGPSGEWLPYFDPSVDTPMLIDAMDKAGVEKAVIFPNPDVGDSYPELNDYIIGAVDEYPDRFIGFGRVDPRRGDDAVEEVKRCSEEGLIGIKLHPYVETYRPDHDNFSELFDTLHEEDMIVLSHTGSNFASAGHMKKVVEDREGLKVILGHLNEGSISAAKEYENVYVDTSGARVYLLEFACNECPERVVFGSDYPYLNYEVQKKVVKAADISDEMEQAIFRDNLNRILHG